MDEIRAFATEVVRRIGAAAPPTIPARVREVLGVCPICGEPVTEGRKAYTCATGKACSFVIFKRIAGRTTSPALVKVLLGRGRTQQLRGFRSKKGRRFPAVLVLDDEGKVRFDFGARSDARRAKTTKPSKPAKPAKRPSRASEPAKSAPAPAPTPRGPRCPACRQGRVIAGRRGWGCSRWREGCAFVVWFEQRGLRIPDDEGERLFRRRQTRLMEGLVPDGRARLVLDLSQEGNVRVELAKRRKKPQ